MVCITDCAECKNRLPNIDGWLACCKAFPYGMPKDFDYRNLKERKVCNLENGIGFESHKEREKEVNKMIVLDGSFEEQVATLKSFFGLSPEQSFQDMAIDNENNSENSDESKPSV